MAATTNVGTNAVISATLNLTKASSMSPFKRFFPRRKMIQHWHEPIRPDRLRVARDRAAAAFANIPPKANRRSKPDFSTWLYRERNQIERFFSKLKHFRRVETRNDKLAENFLAMVQLASMRLWLRVCESTA